MDFILHDHDDPVSESPRLDSTHKDECVDGIVNDDRNTSSDIGNADDSFDEPVSDHCFDDWQTVSGDSTVECLPDYILYREKYSTDSVVTFSSSCIKIEGYWQDETFEFQWGVDHIMNIECQWCERLELATVKIRVNLKGTTPTEDIHGHTGFEEFKFAIVEDWYRKQDEIMSLDVYQPLWNIVLSSDMERDAKVLPGQSKIFPSKHYFPSFEDSFEDVIYPKGDADAVSLSKRDVDRLEPDTFVNDTIIDFYIKYLKNKVDPSERHRFHFFNSFFYPKLAELGKSPSSSLEGRTAFRSVRRWTRKISLFEKDYIFVPVNFNYHWSLIVICHPGEVADFQDSDARKSLKLPCILHMDSIRGSHSGLKGLIQSYLWEEWKERQEDTSEDISLKFSNMRFFSLELPQQQNLYDCGLFLLHYVELFLEGNLVNFNPLKISKFSNFLTANWFQPAEASLKRAYIQRLIYDILDDGSCESSPSTGGDENCTSMYPRSVDENKTTSEFRSDKSSFSKVFHESVPCSEAGQGLELTLLQTSFAESIHPVNDSGLVSRGPDEAIAAVESLCQGFEKTAPSEEFKNVSESIQLVNDSSFVSGGPDEAEAAVESFCQAFEKAAPSEEFKNGSESIQHVNDSGLFSRGLDEAEVAVESFCQAFEKTAPSEEFKNASESIQLVNDPGFVSKGPDEAKAAVEFFCQAFEQTAPSEEFKNASESIQPVNDPGFVSRGPAEADAAETAPSEEFNSAIPPIKEEDESYKHFRCSSLGTTGFQEPTTVTSEASGAYLSKESGEEPLWNLGSNICQNVHMDIDSFKESICASNDLLKSEDANHSKIGTNLSMEVKLDHHQPKFSSQDNLELSVDFRVYSLSDHMLNGNNNEFSRNRGSPLQNCDALEDRSAACEPLQSICDGSGTCVEQVTKKRRLTPMEEGPNSDEDLHD